MYFICFFLVYSVHINNFFLPNCKNLYTFFLKKFLQRAHQSFFSSIRIYVLFFSFVLFFFGLQRAHQSFFFLPFRIVRIYYFFLRIRINVLIIFESIIICFLGYFYNTKWKNMTYTQTKLLRSRVLCEEMQSFSKGGEIKRQGYLPFITKRRNKKTKKKKILR